MPTLPCARRTSEETAKRRDKYVRSASDDKPMSLRETELSNQVDDLRASLVECKRQLAEQQEAERMSYQSYTNYVPPAMNYFVPTVGCQQSYQLGPPDLGGAKQYQAPVGPTDSHNSVPRASQGHKWKPKRLNPDTCRKCFQSGHWAKDCPQTNRTKSLFKKTTQPNVQVITKKGTQS